MRVLPATAILLTLTGGRSLGKRSEERSLFLRWREQSLALACTGNLAVWPLFLRSREQSRALPCTGNLAVSSLFLRLRERSPTLRKVKRRVTGND
jgi:hypothetical protein